MVELSQRPYDQRVLTARMLDIFLELPIVWFLRHCMVDPQGAFTSFLQSSRIIFSQWLRLSSYLS